jgi:tetratricopeptide (TPR) repeat protein
MSPQRILKGNFLIFGAVWLFSLAGCGPEILRQANPLTSPEHHFVSGLHMLELQKYWDAEREFQLALNLDSRFAKARVGMGLVYGYEGNYDGSRQEFFLAEKDIRGEDRVWIYLGRLRILPLERKKDWLEGSLKAFNQLVELWPDRGEPYYFSGLAYLGAHDFLQAGKLFEKATHFKQPWAARASEELALLREIEQARPETHAGKEICLAKRVRRSQTAVLLAQETKIASALLVLPLPGPVPAPPRDLQGHPYKLEIEQIARLRLPGLSLTPDGTFRADDFLAKDEFAALVFEIVKRFKKSSITPAPEEEEISLRDLPEKHPYYQAALFTLREGIFEMPRQKKLFFRPKSPLSGVETLLALRRLEKKLQRP